MSIVLRQIRWKYTKCSKKRKFIRIVQVRTDSDDFHHDEEDNNIVRLILFLYDIRFIHEDAIKKFQNIIFKTQYNSIYYYAK